MSRSFAARFWPAGLLVVLTCAVYSATLSAGFVWDDDTNVTANPTVLSADGLARIWLDPLANQQYYPLTHTSFWIQYRLFGARPGPYHALNVLLQAASAVLLWRVLRGLAMPGAWLAAGIFAVHPLQVESVAWVTERKNTLAGIFLMVSALYFLRDAGLLGASDASAAPPRREPPRRHFGLAALAFFLLALASKTAVATAPAALLAVVWWKRGRIGRDVAMRVAPLVALAIAAGVATAWIEKHHVGATGGAWSLGLHDKVLLAGRVLWFYAGKFAWPSGQAFIYPRWTLGGGGPLVWLSPVTAALVPVALGSARRWIGRGPAAAALAYGLLIAPASGFFDLFFFRYSFVQDHFQYFGCIALAALLGAALASLVRQRIAFASVSVAIVLVLGTLSWQRSHVFKDSETLWLDTLARNSGAWMARANLAKLLTARGDADAAAVQLREAVRSHPQEAEVYNL
ncbi:MAG: O-GlcNAc transferase, partial [Acidobacteriia bacterium]|nr:O-GlcNAc transferase [Terriglobia bacterium]